VSSVEPSAAPISSKLEALARRPVGRVAVIASRLVLAGLFAMAAVPKILDPTSFARDVENYHLLPPELVAIVAVLLPPLELVLSIALLTGVHARGAAIVTGGLLLAFAGGMAQAIARGIDLDCGCFGSALAMEVSGWTIARNLALFALAMLVAIAPDVPFRGVPRATPAPA
jgi:putative oxidoreductase